MKTSHRVAVVSALLFVGTGAWFQLTEVQPQLPSLYSTLDKSKPWNEIAAKLDPLLSDAEYDAMRTRYFFDVVAARVQSGYSVRGTFEEFMKLTERPKRWDRRFYPGGPPRYFLIVFLASGVYILLYGTYWGWRGVAKPLALKLRDEGVHGMVESVMYGRKGKTPRREG